MYSKKLLKLISHTNLNNIIVLDALYHKTTIFFIRNLSIITIGPLSINMNYKDLDIVIPISHDNIFFQSFFLHIILNFKKLAELNTYTIYYSS